MCRACVCLPPLLECGVVLKLKKLGAWGFARVIASQSELSREEMSILREESVLQSNPYTRQADPAAEALLIPSQLPLLFIFHSVQLTVCGCR